MEINDITDVVIRECIQIHKKMGPGLLESVYERILERRLLLLGLKVDRQKMVRFEYEGLVFEDGLRLDLLVEDKVIVELKSVEVFHRVHYKQLLSYLRLLDKKVGLLINFGQETLRDGLVRMVNDYEGSTKPPSRG
ncbi:MAG: GxxExxY protein [Leptospira sp.]|nr:GxxExxY protein [Leptospira sp.]